MEEGKHQGSKTSTSKPKKSDNIVHYFGKYVTLVEDTFGMLLDSTDQPILVKRFTWSNHNRISVSVITYGARIVSMKLPDRGANVEEIVLGFDDLAGYMFYEEFGLGATLGRTTTKLFKSTYVVDGKQYWLESNLKEHHEKGGRRGLDKVNWTPYVYGNVLQLSYMSPDGDEGYPGDLHVRITFELTTTAEFRMSITANTSKVTPVDITNLTYVNLAGHQAGEEEVRKHELLINANCYTLMDEDNEFPTGEIMNVVHTRNNFQIPTLLGNAMSEDATAAFDQNFCVNRGVEQGDAFVARLVHPYKGRVLEIYSNQRGVNFSNGGEFPSGRRDIPIITQLYKRSESFTEFSEGQEALFTVVNKLADYFHERLNLAPEEYQGFLKNLIDTIAKKNAAGSSYSMSSFSSHLDLIQTNVQHMTTTDVDLNVMLKPLEMQFLKAVRDLIPLVTDDMPFDLIKDAIDELLLANYSDEIVADDVSSSFIRHLIQNQIETMNSRMIHEYDNGMGAPEEEEGNELEMHRSIVRHLREAKASKDKKVFRSGVPIPSFYKKDRITGRGGVIYRTFGGVALRTQGYPSALQYPNFPSSILRPNETYKHTISYKFWILAGNPDKWLRRLELGPCVDVSDLSTPSNSTDC